MKKGTKIWLWVALVLGACTTAMNLMEQRWLSVAIAVVALVGLSVLLFTEKKLGYYLMCTCYLASFIVGVVGSVQAGTGVAIGVLMSFIGSIITPGITFLFIRSQWKDLK